MNTAERALTLLKVILNNINLNHSSNNVKTESNLALIIDFKGTTEKNTSLYFNLQYKRL